jgi:hypothetical protein
LLGKLSGFDYNFKEYPNPVMDRNKTIRYINYYYSKGTPLEKDYPDFKARKAAAAVLAGFEFNPKSGDFHPKVSAMLSGADAMVNRMIVSFCAHNYSTEFSSLMAIRDMFLRALDSEDDANKVIKVFQINEKMRELELSMLNGDKHMDVSVALIQRVEEIKLELKPEDVAMRIAKGRKPIDFELYA